MKSNSFPSSLGIFVAIVSTLMNTLAFSMDSPTDSSHSAHVASRDPALLEASMSSYVPPPPGGQPNYFGPESNYANSPFVKLVNGAVVPNTGIRKFVNKLAGLGINNQNDLGQYIPVAVPDTTTYPGSDYYEIAVVEYDEKLHSDLGPTKLRGYVQINSTNARVPHYLGPMILARSNRPVRLKFVNQLPIGSAGNLFLPVDTSVMGAGTGYLPGPEMYTQNRAVIHLHGGNTPWISDGTPHQWITPAGEVTPYAVGASKQNVPDMPNPGNGAVTLYYTNEQSSRLMYYHDHTYGITRLNVYAGEAAPYMLTDDVEEALIATNVLPDLGGDYRYGIPLIIQDKTFVPPQEQLIKQDPTWNYLKSSGSLWYPHVYMPNQNPNDNSGSNPFGRWDYGPWFWPPVTAAAGLVHGPILDPNGSGLIVPGTPNPSIVPESYNDTLMVNGTVYPYLEVKRKAYRFRILNTANDRALNLQLYWAEPLSISITDAGAGYVFPPKVIFYGGKFSGSGEPAKAKAIIKDGKVVKVEIIDAGGPYISPPFIKFVNEGGCNGYGAHAVASVNTEVKMISACPDTPVPSYYPMMDGRAGGVPDPATSGPSMIQIGNEGGFLPNPAVLPNTPIGYNYNRRDITVLNIQEKTLFLSPAERADVIIDFSRVPEHVSTLILYNDAPSPLPAFDPRYDYYSNNPDFSAVGAAPSTIVGYAPNTRTVMQFRLRGPKGKPYNLNELQAKLPVAYVNSQPPPIVPETFYPLNYSSTTDTFSRIEDTSITFTPYGASSPITLALQPKAIHELFELDYGRMNALLGTELPLTNFGTQTTVPLFYRDPPTEFLANDEIQFWKITHNGVDTHPIHFHLYNVQLINRVGWDGMIKPPDANEIGWKETVRMNPLEDCIVAAKPVKQTVPFTFPDSIRPLDPTLPLGATWQSLNPTTGAAVTVTNQLYNYGEEYVWHCHMLDHEENDMMRPMSFNLIPTAPTDIIATAGPGLGQATITFTPSSTSGRGGPISNYTVTSNPGNITASGALSPIVINGLTSGATYTFTVKAANAAGSSQQSAVSNAIIEP